jgi:hypothetical protein
LAQCDAQTVTATEEAINAFSRPFLHTTVRELLRRGQPLIYDLDLTGQPVSSTSTTYPEAAFGWMNDQVQLGYQLARVALAARWRAALAGRLSSSWQHALERLCA